MGIIADTQRGYRDAPACANRGAWGYDSAMSIFDRIGNLAKGVWIQNTRPNAPDPLHDAALERELEKAARASAAAARPRVAPETPTASPVAAPVAPVEPARPIELDPDGAVKRTL